MSEEQKYNFEEFCIGRHRNSLKYMRVGEIRFLYKDEDNAMALIRRHIKSNGGEFSWDRGASPIAVRRDK